MKEYVKPLIFLIALVVPTLPLFFHFPRVVSKPASQTSSSQAQLVNKIIPGLPLRLTIPAIKVDASVQLLGVTAKGAMEVPTNTIDVGWFKFGSRPGEKGSAVIAGHLNTTDGQPGVFARLSELKPGDKIFVKDDQERSFQFNVNKTETYEAGYAESVYNLNDNYYLNLITCSGTWNNSKNSYDKRLIVTAILD